MRGRLDLNQHSVAQFARLVLFKKNYRTRYGSLVGTSGSFMTRSADPLGPLAHSGTGYSAILHLVSRGGGFTTPTRPTMAQRARTATASAHTLDALPRAAGSGAQRATGGRRPGAARRQAVPREDDGLTRGLPGARYCRPGRSCAPKDPRPQAPAPANDGLLSDCTARRAGL